MRPCFFLSVLVFVVFGTILDVRAATNKQQKSKTKSKTTKNSLILSEEELKLLLLLRVDVDHSTSTGTIPRVIYQSYHLKHLIPPKVGTNFLQFGREYTRFIFNDTECVAFLQKYYKPSVTNTFHELVDGAHKADLFRYAILYVHGGVYIDIKTELLVPLSDTLTLSRSDAAVPHSASAMAFNARDNMANSRELRASDPADRPAAPDSQGTSLPPPSNNTVGSSKYGEKTTFSVLSGFLNESLFQGVIASPPANPLFLRLIHHLVVCEKPIEDYLLSARQMYVLISLEVGRRVLSPGLLQAPAPGNFNYFLLEERSRPVDECYDGEDRYGGCWLIFRKNTVVLKTRYADYPWHTPPDEPNTNA